MQGRLKRQIAAVSSLLVMLFFFTNLTGRADEMVELMGSGAHFVVNPMVNKNQAKILEGPNYKYRKFAWNLKSVKANGIKNGRLSEKTTQIEMTIYGGMNSFDPYFRPLYNFQAANYAVMLGEKDVITTIGTSASISASSTNFKLWGRQDEGTGVYAGVSKTITVDLTNLKDKLPLKVGFQFVGRKLSNGQLVKFSYYLGEFEASGVALKPTIDGDLTADSLAIRGHGTPGDLVTSNVADSPTVSIDAWGNYTIPLRTALKSHLEQNDRVVVTETNENGDTGTAVQKKLRIAAVAQSPEFDLEDEENLDLTQVDQLVKSLKLDSGEAVGANFYYDLTQDELKKRIASLEAGNTIVLPIYATKAGYIRSNILNVKVSNSTDAVAFDQTTTALSFGGVKKVPLITTDYFPDKPWGIIVRDHRKNKPAWKITAQALASTPGDNDLTDYLWYKDGTNQICFKNHESILVYEKSADANNDETTISFRDASQTKQELPNQRSIFVQAGPKMKVGKYQAKILWSLLNAP